MTECFFVVKSDEFGAGGRGGLGWAGGWAGRRWGWGWAEIDGLGGSQRHTTSMYFILEGLGFIGFRVYRVYLGFIGFRVQKSRETGRPPRLGERCIVGLQWSQHASRSRV